MATIDLGDDEDGFVTVSMGGAEVRLDLWRTNNQIFDFHESHKNHPDAEYNDKLVELVTGMGFPKCSQRMATKFMKAIGDALGEAKKKP